jgi:hypothetical protein
VSALVYSRAIEIGEVLGEKEVLSPERRNVF